MKPKVILLFLYRPFCFKSRKVYFYAHSKKLAMFYCQISISLRFDSEQENQNGGIKMSKNIVSVYDTITKRYVEIEVSEKIRTYYNRTQWNIDDNNKSFYKHEIQFSALKGNINGELENFQEFRTENDDVERRVIQNIKFEKLYSCLNELSEDERRLIFAIYFENKTENEVACFLHTTQQNINKKKRRILCKLNKLLKPQ